MAVEIWWSSLVAADRELFDVLDGTERARVEALSRPADQGRSMVGAALLRAAVGHRLGVPARDIVVDRRCAECGLPHGRPKILGPWCELPGVSVSHSGVLIVVAVSTAPVGIDVQRISDLPTDGDGTGQSAAEAWVAQEAIRKLGPVARAAVQQLRPPIRGYAAALAAPSDPAPDRSGRHGSLSPSTGLRHAQETVRYIDAAELRALTSISAAPPRPVRPTPDRARQR